MMLKSEMNSYLYASTMPRSSTLSRPLTTRSTASCTVTYQGLLYPLAHDTLTSGGVLMGVSNTITADTAVIRVHAGTALVVVYTA